MIINDILNANNNTKTTNNMDKLIQITIAGKLQIQPPHSGLTTVPNFSEKYLRISLY